jgi:hypothetical protein
MPTTMPGVFSDAIQATAISSTFVFCASERLAAFTSLAVTVRAKRTHRTFALNLKGFSYTKEESLVS